MKQKAKLFTVKKKSTNDIGQVLFDSSKTDSSKTDSNMILPIVGTFVSPDVTIRSWY